MLMVYAFKQKLTSICYFKFVISRQNLELHFCIFICANTYLSGSCHMIYTFGLGQLMKWVISSNFPSECMSVGQYLLLPGLVECNKYFYGVKICLFAGSQPGVVLIRIDLWKTMLLQ